MSMPYHPTTGGRVSALSKQSAKAGTSLRDPRARRQLAEPLEARIAPAVLTWDGGGDGVNWSDAENWLGDVSPTAGDDLVFTGLGATTVDDFAAGTRFNTIVINGSGFTLAGNSIELYGGLTANHTAGANTVGLDITLVNAQTIMNANAGATLHLTGTVHTAGLVGATNVLGTSALTFDGAGTTQVSGVIDGLGSVNKLGTGTLVLSGANTYEGLTDVRQGILRAEHNSAFGSATTGHTDVQAGASLHVAGGITVAEPLALREGGVGFGDGTDASSLGGLRSAGTATNTWSGNIDIVGGNNLIGVDAGGTLNISGVISNATSLTNRLIKVGAGTLQLTGAEDNVFRGETRVLQGTLELGKTPGRNAIGGSLVIGDDIEASGTKTVRLLASNQMPHVDFFGVGLTTLTVLSTGVFSLNGFNETVGNVVLNVGATNSADILLGGGTLTLGGASVTVNGFQGSSGASPAATISGGTLDLGSFFSGSGGGLTKAFTVNDTQLANVATDLHIAANITGTADVSLTQTGNGTLRLSGNNFGMAGPFILGGAGIVEVASNNAFGASLLSVQGGGVIKAVGAPRTINNPIGFDSNLTTLGENLTFNGAVTLSGDRTLFTMDAAQTVTINGVIGEGIFGSRSFSKGGRGTLVLTATETYSGQTNIFDAGGTLVLRHGGTLLNSHTIAINDDATLKLDNSGTANLSDRINDRSIVQLDGGELSFVAGTSGSTETLGLVSFGGDVSSRITSDSALGNAQLLIQRSQLNFNGTVALTALGADFSTTGGNRVIFAEFPVINTTEAPMFDGVAPRFTVRGASGLDMATFASASEGLAVVGLSSIDYVTDINAAGSLSNVRLGAGVHTLTASRTINSLFLEDGAILNGADFVLSVDTGAVILGNNATVNVEVLNLSARSYLMVNEGNLATISSTMTGGGTAISKIGRGQLVLTGDNQFVGNFFLDEGVLNIQRSTALGNFAQTSVRYGATLELEQTSFGPVDVGLEVLNLQGTGFNDSGALRNVAGNNSWAGAITQAAQTMSLLNALDGAPVITTGQTWYRVETGSALDISGVISTNVEMIKMGGGTLELSGALANTFSATTRILEGTLLLNKEPGVLPLTSTVEIGSDKPGALAATLRLGGSDQIPDGVTVRVRSSGFFDLNGHSEVTSGLELIVGASGAGDVNIGAGGMLTTTANVNVFTVGTGNPAGATITGGTLALQLFGLSGGPVTRTWQVNDGTAGVDLTVTSAIVDGTGLQSVNLTKSGFGTLELGGATANTYTGTTLVSEGTLLLNKGTGAGGVSAMRGPLTIGDTGGAVSNGFARSDVVRWLQSEQLPDSLTLTTVSTSGWLDLNGFNETIGNVDAQNALTLQAGSRISTGAGTLAIRGNISASATNFVNLWTVVAPALIEGRLDLGGVVRTIDIADRSELPVDFMITADISGTGGLRKTGTGLLLLGGQSTYTGATFLENGSVAAASDDVFGDSLVYFSQGGLLAEGGLRTLANSFQMGGTVSFNGGNNVGGGGNALNFAGPVNLTFLTTVNTAVAGTVEFSGGVGEAFGAVSLVKSGFGTLVISSAATHSSATTINNNGGAIVLRGDGALLNTSAVTINVGGSLVLDNQFGANLGHRLNDLTNVTLTGGRLQFVGKAGAFSSETIGNLVLSDNSSSTVESLVSTAAGSEAEWRINSIDRGTALGGEFVRFAGRGTDIGASTDNRIVFTTAPTRTDGIIDFAVLDNEVGGLNFATHYIPAGTSVPTSFAGYLDIYDASTAPLVGQGTFATSLGGATANTNVRLSGGEALLNPATANALLLANGGIIVLGGSVTLDSGLVASTGVNNQILVSTLTLGGADANIFVDGQSDLDLFGAVSGATGINEVQRFFLGGTPTDGVTTFTLTFNGQTTADIAYSATPSTLAANMQAALEALSNVGAGNIAVSVVTNSLFDIAFQGTLGAINQPAITGTLVTAGGAFTPAFTGIAAGNLGSLGKHGSGMLIMSGGTANTFDALTRVNEGIFRAAKDTAFGSTVNGVNVTYGATVELSGGVNIPAETLTLTGSGEGATANVTLRNFSGTNIWQGDIVLNTNRTGLDVIVGSELIVNGILSGNGFNKFGGGTLELGGGSANTMGNAAVIWNGTVELNKTPGVNATANSITIGDQVGPAGSAVLRWLASDQLIDTFAVTLNADGQLDLNGFNETLGAATALTMTVGPLASASAVTGGGVLTVNGNVTLNSLAGGRPSPATISGNLAIGGAAVRTFTVNDSAAAEDLVIDAALSDAALDWIKAGSGQMVLSGANTFTGNFQVNTGEVVVRHASALGNTGGGALTAVNFGGALLIDGVSISETLTINGAGAIGRGSLVNLAGNNTLNGPLTLIGNAVVSVAGSSNLTQVGSVSGAFTLFKLLPGTLTLGGGVLDLAPNSHNGTTVQEGMLVLDKADGTTATVALTVGDNTVTGGAGADIARLARNNQISGPVTVLASGLLDFNGAFDTITGLSLAAGPIFSARIDLNGGLLILGGDVAQTTAGGIATTLSPAAKIEDGALSLGGATRVFTTTDAGLNIRELQIDAIVIDAGFGFTVSGLGFAAFTANNSGTLTGTVNLSGANVIVGHDNALGSGTVNVLTTASSLYTSSQINLAAITLANAVTLNQNLTLRGDRSFTLGTVSGQGAANRSLIDAMQVGATATVAGGINLSDNVTAREFQLTNLTFNNPFAITGVIANGSGATHAVRVLASNDAVVFSNANSYSGNTTIDSNGMLRITHSNALGTGAGAVVEVSQGGVLEVDGSGGAVNVTSKVLRLRATTTPAYGFKNMEFGAVRNLAGANSWTNAGTGAGAGAVDLRSDGAIDRQFWIGVDAGTLNFVGQIAGTDNVGAARQGHTVVKTGTGTLRYSGTEANLITGTTTMLSGMLELNKPAGVNALAGAVTVGDGGGGLTGDTLRWLATDQITTSTVVVSPSGNLAVNGQSDTIGTLTLQRTANLAPSINTTGLTIDALNLNNVGATNSSTPFALITGTLGLGTAVRTFTIDDALRIGSGLDLAIDAVIGGAGGGITKAGFGTLALGANNTFTGATTVNAGTFTDSITRLGGSLVLDLGGDIAQSSSVTVNAGASLMLDNSNGFASDAAGRIGNTTTITLAGGTLAHIGHASTAVDEVVGTITVNAANVATGGESSVIRSVWRGADVALSGVNLARGAGGSAHFVGEGADLGSTANRVRFSGTIANVTNSTLTWATLDQNSNADLDFVTHLNAISGIGAAAFVTSLAAATPTSNVKLTAGEATAAKTINALMLTGGVIDVTGGALTITGALVVNNGGSNTIGTDLDFGASEAFTMVEEGSRLSLNGAVSGSGAFRKERDGTLVLAGNNTGLSGAVVVNDGVLQVAHSGALGTTANGTSVTALAALVLDGANGALNLGSEAMTFLGTGVDNDGSGVLRLINGDAIVGTGTTAFTTNTTNVIAVETGRTLTLNGVLGAGSWTKSGGGTLELSGTTNNSGSPVATVLEGTVLLNKSGTAIALPGQVNIGNGATNARVLYASTAGTNQIGVANVTIAAGSLLDLNGISDDIASLSMTGGAVETGAGTLTVNGTVTYSAGSAAVINGQLNLGNGTRTVAVADGKDLNDLTINAAISNGKIVKANGGLLLLNNPANSFTAGGDEVQSITLTGAPTFGATTFTLTINGATTATINYETDAATTAANIQNTLQALAGIGAGGVTVSPVSPLVYQVTYTGHLGSADVPGTISGAFVNAAGGTAITGAQVTAGVAGVRLNAGLLALGSDTALGSARLQIDGGSGLIASGGARVLANDVTINPNLAASFGGRREYEGTNALTLSGGVTLIGPATGQVINLDVNDNQTLVTISGVISGGGDLMTIVKRGIGTLVWSGNNTFDVRSFVPASSLTSSDGIRVEGGILRLAHSNALGTSAQNASISLRADLGAVLEIDGTTANGPVVINGRVLDIGGTNNGISSGFLNRTSTEAAYTGVVRNLGGANQWNAPAAGEIRLRSITDGTGSTTLYLGVDAGSLDLNGALIGLENDATPTVANNRALYKTGEGTLRTSGTTANTLTNGYFVLEGSLELNKSAGVNAIAGPLFVGDNFGSGASAQVTLLQGNQIADAQTVTINTDGRFDLAGQSETFGPYAAATNAITLVVGDASSGQLTTGAGNLTLMGSATLANATNVLVNLRPGTTSAGAPAAVISGNVTLFGGAANQASTFTVNDGPGETELLVSAAIGGATEANLTKAGAGRLSLTGDNSYVGATIVGAGALRVSHNNALGGAGGTAVSVGAALELSGGISLSDAITLNGNGIFNAPGMPLVAVTTALGSGALRSIDGDNSILGGVTIAANNVSVDTAAGSSLNLAGVVAFGNNLNSIKTGEGTLEFSGNAANTFTSGIGRFYVNEGELVLNKQGANVAMPIVLFVGDGIGGAGADVVRYAATAGTDQIANNNHVIHSSGLLDLNNVSDTVSGFLTLTVGPSASGELRTGSGTYSNAGGFIAISQTGITVASPSAVISGNLNLVALERTFEIRRAHGLLAPELDLQAVVTNGGISKLGDGSLRLAGANTFAGETSVLAGNLIVAADSALGAPTSGTFVSEGASLIFPGGINYTLAEPMAVIGRGVNGEGAIQNFGVNTFAGTILASEGRVENDVLLASHSGLLTVGGAVTLRDVQLEVGGAGDLTLNGGIVGGTAMDGIINGFDQRFYLANSGSVATNLADLFAASLQVRNVYTGPINFPNDAAFDAAAGLTINGLNSNFAAAWTTSFTPNESGVWQFQNVSGLDDAGGIWIDANQNGSFELTEVIGARTGSGAPFGPYSTPALVAGQTYLMGVAVSDNGGAGIFSALQYRTPSGAFTNLDPSDVAQNGLWTVTAEREALTKTGVGTLTIGGASTYAGDTRVKGGSLVLTNATGSATGTGGLFLEDFTNLAGTGQRTGSVFVANATVAPGVGGVGTLSTGDFVSAGALNAEVNGTFAGQHDSLRVTGAVNLSGTTLNLTGTVTKGISTVVLIDNDGDSDVVSGTFSGYAEGATATVNGVDFTVSYVGGDGNDVVLIPAAPATLVGDLSVTTQGDEAGAVSIVFTITLDQVNATGAPITFDLAEAVGGTATSGADYASIPSGTQITIANGATTGTYTMTVNDDAFVEGLETVAVMISNPSTALASVGMAAATASIADNDMATVSIAATTPASEPATNGQFTVSLSVASSTDTVVSYTVAGTATAGADYSALTGTVTIFAGQTSATIDVPVLNDQAVEMAETVIVTLTGITAGDPDVSLSGTTQATVTISDDGEPPPTISIDDVTLVEGNSGTTNMVFTVTLSAPSALPVTVAYATVNGTAIAPGDYTTLKDLLTFAPGETSKTIAVPVAGDTLYELGVDETFLVNLSAPTNASLADTQGLGAITSDDAVPANVVTINAKTPFTFLDANNDKVTVKLVGAGTGTVSLVGGVNTGADISEIILTGTDAKSSLSVTVKKDKTQGDGAVSIGEVTVDGALKSFSAKTGDLVSGGLRATGTVNSITARNLTHGEILTGGLATSKLALTLGAVSDNTLIQSSATISALKAISIGVASVTASNFGAISTTAGAIAADITTVGTIASITAKGGGLSGDVLAASLGAVTITGGDFSGALTSLTSAASLGKLAALKSLTITGGDLLGDVRVLGNAGPVTVKTAKVGANVVGGNITGASIVAGQLASLTVAKNVTSSVILSGADLGADHVLSAGDTFAAASLGAVKIGGNVSGASVIGAGLSTVNAVFKDGDDTIVPGIPSVVKSFTITGTASADSYFAGGVFKAAPKIGGLKVVLPDARFLTA